ncbi:MAG TPA: hypothetical protein VFU11_05005 [Solirubrobacterales bacterium]|nr:hypothetical protein [Solirubrobacterales bacterium]
MRLRARRLVPAAVLLAFAVVLLAHPVSGAASDVWGNVGPSPQLGGQGIAGRYPLTNYSLDQHFDAVEASLTGGVNVDGVAPMIAYFLASILWLATSFLANLLITLFSFAFSLDLVNGSQATGGQGALAPVSRAIHAIYSDVFGAPWLVLAVVVAGIWAMWKALVQRRYSETAGALGLSLIYVVLALFFVAQPGTTIGSVSKWTNQMSGAFLSISSEGTPSSGRKAKEATANELFDLLVFKPWVVLNFGGLEHCVRGGTGSDDSDPESVPVRPLSPDPDRDSTLERRLQAGTEITAGEKVCVNNSNKYAHRFLRFGLGDDERAKEYDALNDGDASDLAVGKSGYRLGVADKPATDAMEEGGQYQRLLLALVLFLGELGAFLLLGALSIGIILAQVLLLLLLAFSPVALVAAAVPGRGHDFFTGWLQKLAGFVLRKAAYSLILAILLAVNGALASATAQLGWLMSFGLQSLFFWAVFLQRRTLADSLIGIATGPGTPGRDGSLRVLGLYAGARMGGRALRPLRRAGRSVAGAPGRLFGGGGTVGDDGGPARPRRAPLFGRSYSAPVGGGHPSLDAPGPAKHDPHPPRSDGETSRRAGGSPADPPVSGSRTSPSEAPEARKKTRQTLKGDSPREEGRRTGRAPSADRPEKPQTADRRTGAGSPPAGSRQRDQQSSAGRPPVQSGGASAGKPEKSLAEELRDEERQRGSREARPKPRGPQEQVGDPEPPQKRKRRNRKGGSR